MKKKHIIDKILAKERRVFKAIKDKDMIILARIISDWSRGLHPELDAAKLIRSLCESQDMGELGRAIDALERVRAGNTSKVLVAYYNFFNETGRKPTKRDIAKRTGCSERTVQVIFDEWSFPFTRMKPWQQNK